MKLSFCLQKNCGRSAQEKSNDRLPTFRKMPATNALSVTAKRFIRTPSTRLPGVTDQVEVLCPLRLVCEGVHCHDGTQNWGDTCNEGNPTIRWQFIADHPENDHPTYFVKLYNQRYCLKFSPLSYQMLQRKPPKNDRNHGVLIRTITLHGIKHPA